MKIIETIEDLIALKGEHLGYSNYIKIDQQRIDAFANATEDHQYIHVDPKKTMAAGMASTIAHGFLTMSLGVKLLDDIIRLPFSKMGVNYGLEKLRFTNMVPVNSNVRMGATLTEIETLNGGHKLKMACVFEIEGVSKPACIMDWIYMVY